MIYYILDCAGETIHVLSCKLNSISTVRVSLTKMLVSHHNSSLPFTGSVLGRSLSGPHLCVNVYQCI